MQKQILFSALTTVGDLPKIKILFSALTTVGDLPKIKILFSALTKVGDLTKIKILFSALTKVGDLKKIPFFCLHCSGPEKTILPSFYLYTSHWLVSMHTANGSLYPPHSEPEFLNF